MEYEKKQRDIYNSAQNKLKNSLLQKNFSQQAYFEGTGFYQYYQKIEKRPNIYDTRETFLLKMHNPEIRDNFLDELHANFSEKTAK